MNVLIIDDEKDSREIISSYLTQYFPKANIIGEADSVSTGVELILNSEFDLLFLDIQLNNETSFDILDQLVDFHFDIIFITAHDDYAINAIKHNAMDYLLKPLIKKEFIKSVNFYLQKSKNKSKEQFNSLVKDFNNSESKKQIKLPTLTGFKIVNVKDIIHLESDGNYTYVNYINGNKDLVSKGLKDFENKLPKRKFCRVHNSHIVNLDYVKEYINGRGGQVILTNNTVLTVSQKKKRTFLKNWN